MDEKLLIMAYMGTGKSELENRYENVVDFDFQDYKYIYDESIRHLPLEQNILNGSGTLYLKDKEKTSFKEGDVILLDKKECYAFEGNFEAAVSCTPAWTSEQHQYVD